MSFSRELDPTRRRQLVEALLKCDCLAKPRSRDQIVKDLPPDIQHKIERAGSNLDDVQAIVDTCNSYSGGLDALLKLVEWKEGGSFAWRNVIELTNSFEAAPADHAPENGKQSSAKKRSRSSKPKYDVFLSHNSVDKPQVEILASRLLSEYGLTSFLDKERLIPGKPWIEALEQALDESDACAVFLGPSGLGDWQKEEMQTALDRRVKDPSFRVIPVLLPGADPKDKKSLSRFLSRLTWVDFRTGIDDEEPLRRLAAGIRGEEPGQSQK